MRLEWLEDILAVAQTGSFSEAAERRLLTQSAFSRRIHGIEEYIGVELFDRSRKPVQLRQTTEAQRDQIERLASELRQLADDLRRGHRLASNRIVIASQHALTTGLTPAIVKGIQTRGDNTYVRLRSANLDECYALLLSHQADIALLYRVPGEDHAIKADYINTINLSSDRLIPVYSNVGNADLNALLALKEVPYVAYPREVFLGQVMERLILPRVRNEYRTVASAETALTLAALEMAAVGVAVAWVPASLARPRIESGQLVDLSGTLPNQTLEVIAARLSGDVGVTEARIWQDLSQLRLPGFTS